MLWRKVSFRYSRLSELNGRCIKPGMKLGQIFLITLSFSTIQLAAMATMMGSHWSSLKGCILEAIEYLETRGCHTLVRLMNNHVCGCLRIKGQLITSSLASLHQLPIILARASREEGYLTDSGSKLDTRN